MRRYLFHSIEVVVVDTLNFIDTTKRALSQFLEYIEFLETGIFLEHILPLRKFFEFINESVF